MTDLAEFLLARIAEDESRGRADELVENSVPRPTPWRSRMLAECEAKRRIVSMASGRDGYGDQAILQYLAQPYADHPDWREEWRV